MSPTPFHLGWFLAGSNAQAWGRPWSGAVGRDWAKPDLYVDAVRALERACFDYVLLEDNVFVGDTYGGSMDVYLRNAVQVPRMEPLMLAPLLASATSRIGIVPTISTFAYHPYLVARTVGTLDQLSGGRAGWNMVTGSSDRAVQNYGMAAMEPHDTRYEMASEFCDLVNALWDSWEPGAVVADPESGVFVDPEKVRPVDFHGKWYASRGPLNSGPLPQGRAVLAQAGSSPRGRAFAAGYADTVVGAEGTVEGMKRFRYDVRARRAAAGGDPDTVKVLFVVTPVLGESDAEAEVREAQRAATGLALAEQTLAVTAKTTGIDFADFPLDEPLGERELTTNGSQDTLRTFVERNRGRTLREAAALSYGGTSRSLGLVGGLETVAGQLGDIMAEVGGDGFLFASPDLHRRTIAEITDGLVPVLQRRGLVRTGYSATGFRDNLLEF
ncbi:NtaA/DmoA family FMN-dependent monooxygenase [Pseudonocardia pini]|uniref:NtaA/DmoA family FMN-dependent monooxygenase n=1 Tax=Pseudonocardia pini TaxID=2758030 RepID=UPI0015EFEFDF|nr:NtaA/DmoA family FMN-dependent monooxygenase [Pseudonocardia pini]